MPLLNLANVSVHYGAIVAIQAIDLCFNAGDFLCIIGANGAGKSTLLKAIMGLVPLASGKIEYNIPGQNTAEYVTNGLVLVPEGRSIFPNFTVRENLLAGAYTRHKSFYVTDEARVLDLFPKLKSRLTQMAGTLSGGEQQMLAVSRALMAHPKILLLDEPSLGLAPQLADIIFDTLQKIYQQGVSLILVEQNARRALDIAVQASVMLLGKIQNGFAKDFIKDEVIIKAYLGG